MKDPPVRKSKPPPEIPKEEVSRRERKQSQQARSRSKNKIQREFRRPDPPPLPESAEASGNWFANVDIPARPKRDPPKHKPPPVGLGQTPRQPPQGAAPSAPQTAATGSLAPHRDTDLNRPLSPPRRKPSGSLLTGTASLTALSPHYH